MPLLPFAERTSSVALQVSKGAAGGWILEGYLLVSATVSGLASAVWPGNGGDFRRFVEVWARFSEPGLNSTRVSRPLLLQHLESIGDHQTAAGLRRSSKAFGSGEDDRVVTGYDVDLSDSDVLAICPNLSAAEVRRFSYPVLFYKHFRSSIVHEYELQGPATGTSHNDDFTVPSYENCLVRGSPYTSERRIHFPVPWLTDVVKSIAANIDKSGTPLGQGKPSKWWVNG